MMPVLLLVSAASALGPSIPQRQSEGHFDPQAVKELHVFVGHAHMVRRVTFTPDAKYLLSASKDNTVIVWDVSGREMKRRFASHKEWAWQALVLRDGERVISCSDDSVLMWNLRTGKILGEYEGHSDRGVPRGARSLALSPDQGILVSYGMDGTFRIWDVESFKNRSTHKLPDSWTAPSGLAPVWMPMSIAPDGSCIATLGRRSEEVVLWKADMSGERARLGENGKVGAFAFSPDGGSIFVGYQDGKIRRWTLAQKAVDVTFEGHEGFVHGMALTPSGRYLLSVGYDRHVSIWDVPVGKRVRKLKVDYPLLDVAVSIDGAHFATACDGSKGLTPSDHNPVVLWGHSK